MASRANPRRSRAAARRAAGPRARRRARRTAGARCQRRDQQTPAVGPAGRRDRPTSVRPSGGDRAARGTAPRGARSSRRCPNTWHRRCRPCTYGRRRALGGAPRRDRRSPSRARRCRRSFEFRRAPPIDAPSPSGTTAGPSPSNGRHRPPVDLTARLLNPTSFRTQEPESRQRPAGRCWAVPSSAAERRLHDVSVPARAASCRAATTRWVPFGLHEHPRRRASDVGGHKACPATPRHHGP